MLDGNLLYLYKARMLRLLAQYQGMEQREGQLITDAQVHINMNVKPDDIRQAMNALKDDGFAARRIDDVRGMVWCITPDGNAKAKRLALEGDL